jgi:hypothetical protein
MVSAAWHSSRVSPPPAGRTGTIQQLDHGSGDFDRVDLNGWPGPAGLDEVANRVRTRLARCPEPCDVGHADWWSENLRWIERRLYVVHDWDSITAQPEAISAGQAAYLFAAIR